MKKLKAIILILIMTFIPGIRAQEMSKANLEKLSKSSDLKLVEALLLSQYKIEALNRRNEAFDGITPEAFTINSMNLLKKMADEAINLKTTYQDAIAQLGNDSDPITESCKTVYKFKVKLPSLVKRIEFDTSALKFHPYNEQLIRAQAWTRLNLLKNYYINSVASYSSGDAYSDVVGIATKCFKDTHLYEKLAQGESNLLIEIEGVLHKVIGQSGTRSKNLFSKEIAQKFVKEESYWNQVGKTAENIFESTVEETLFYYSGLGLVKYGFKTVSWLPKAYKYLYPVITGGVRGALAAIPKSESEKVDLKNMAAKNVKAFSERLAIYLPFGFQIDEDKLDEQVRHAQEMEKILFHERFDLREESNKLCKGMPCSADQARQLLAKFERNKTEIQFVINSRK